jgi:glycosyltransferase involved in cell wall biosynthesis
MLVSIVVPTFRRPSSLARTLASCSAQSGLDGLEAEVIVVDNCPRRSAEATVKAAASRSRMPVRYLHEPVAGVAAARNTGVADARGTIIVFIDDDQEAEPEWLAELVSAQNKYDADAVFGVQMATFDGHPPAEDTLYLTPFDRRFPDESGVMQRRRYASLGTGCSLFHTRVLGKDPFDPALGLAGGEDSALVKRLVHEGRRIVWCKEARVYDYVPVERASFRFLLKRRFSSGQVRTSTCVVAPPAQPLSALKWMAVGAAQVGIYGTLAAATALVRPPLARRLLAHASGGLGKVLWMPPFRVLRYPTQRQRGRA